MAMRNMLVQGKDSDIGHILENLVYLELRRRGYEVFVGQYGMGDEVDFVAMKNGNIEYYQVAQTTLDDKVRHESCASPSIPLH